jgi:putative PIN family toxin of toxin-antitoxin system
VTPSRLVIDTNAIVSALLFSHGRLSWLRQSWMDGRIIPLGSRPTINELLRVLAYPKFQLTAPEREDLLADLLPFVETVLIPKPPPKIPSLQDPDDGMFLELALAGHADAVVTGDRGLLVAASAFPIPVLPLAELRLRLSL